MCQEVTLGDPAGLDRQGFTDRLQQAMDWRGYNPNSLARALEMSQPTVRAWFEEGAIPNGAALQRLAPKLGVNLHWLITGQGPSAPPTEAEADQARHAYAIAAADILAIVRQALTRFQQSAISGVPNAAEILAENAREKQLVEEAKAQAAARKGAPPKSRGRRAGGSG